MKTKAHPGQSRKGQRVVGPEHEAGAGGGAEEGTLMGKSLLVRCAEDQEHSQVQPLLNSRTTAISVTKKRE